MLGAYQCFKRDQLRLIQHSRIPGTSEALYKDLLLEVQLEVWHLMIYTAPVVICYFEIKMFFVVILCNFLYMYKQ